MVVPHSRHSTLTRYYACSYRLRWPFCKNVRSWRPCHIFRSRWMDKSPTSSRRSLPESPTSEHGCGNTKREIAWDILSRPASNGMDSWPTDCRIHTASTKSRREIEDYARLEHGKLGSLTLCHKEGHLEWIPIVKNATGTLVTVLYTPYLPIVEEHRLRAMGKYLKIFPATRPPPLRLPHTTITQRSEQGVRFTSWQRFLFIFPFLGEFFADTSSRHWHYVRPYQGRDCKRCNNCP